MALLFLGKLLGSTEEGGCSELTSVGLIEVLLYAKSLNSSAIGELPTWKRVQKIELAKLRERSDPGRE